MIKERIKFFTTVVLTFICSVLLGVTIVNAESVANSVTIKSTNYNNPPMSFPQTFHVKKTSSGKWAYCITYAKKTPSSGIKYTKDDVVDDKGKFYILTEAEKNVKNNSDFFIYQTALWIYMSDKGIMNKSYSVTTFRNKVYSSNSATAKKIKSIVAAAKKAPKIDKSAPTIKLSVSNMEMSLSGSNYVSSKIKVSSSTSKYDISLSSAPAGSKYKVSGGYVYVYVPASKVTKMSDTVKLTVKNSKTIYNAQNYKPNNGSYQKMAVVFKDTKNASASVTLKINRKVNINANKTDSNGKGLSGAVLQVKNSKGTVIDKWTSNGSNHVVKNLVQGSYELSEVSAPKGYVLNTSVVKFSIDANGKLKNSSGKVISVVVMKNNQTDVQISKQAITGTSELPGATLILKDASGKQIDKWVSTTTIHHVKGLAAGTYTLTEQTAPDGYKLSEETIKFTLDKYGKLEDANGKSISKVVMKNAQTDVEISKQSITDGSELPGATLILKDVSGKQIDKWVSTTTTHHVKGLSAGTYTLTEQTAPDGYKLSEETITFKIDANGNLTDENGKLIDKVVMKNEQNEVKISKQAITGGSELPGATLILKDASGKQIDKWVSTNEIHYVKGLKVGTYTLTEQTAPDGYKLSEETIKFTIDEYGKLIDDSGKIIDKVVMKNEQNEVKISKQDITTNNELPGAKLVVKNKDGKVVDKWTSTSGVHVIKGITVGTYTLSEIETPKGYVETKETVEFTVNEYGKVIDKNGKEIDKVIMFNTPQKEMNIKISKQDLTTKEELPGATLVIKDKDDKVIDTWVSTDEVHVVKYIIAGTYTLTETVAPNGYKLSEKTIKFTLDKDGNLTDEHGKSIDKVVMYNELKEVVKIKISKQDIATSKELPGASLTVVDSDNNVIDTWVSTNEVHYINDIEAGTYTLTETQAPNGYELSKETIKFTVDENGKLIDENGKAIDKVVMYNKKTDKKSVEISKQDIATSKELPGAKLVVKDENGNEIDTWVSTNESHIIKDIKAGTYTLTEIQAPDGYIISTETIKFTVDENGKLTDKNGNEINKVIMYNEKKKEKNVTISKQDIATSKELPGASLVLKDANGSVIDSWVSTNESHTIKDIKAGTYTLTETQAPSGYKLSTETIKFTIDENGKLTDEFGNEIDKVVMFNKQIPKTDVTISKQDITTSKELPGANLVLKDANGSVIDSWISTNSVHVVKGLTEGTYTLTEIQAPNGYILSTETITFKIDENGKLLNNNGKTIDKVIMYNEKEIVPFNVPIVKQDAKTHKNLAGAVLNIIDETGKIVDSWTTTVEAHYVELTAGSYKLVETSAPAGYVLNSTPVVFNITEDGKLTNTSGNVINSVVMDNTPVETKVSISKQDITNGKEIPGAKLVVKDANGNVIDTWTSTTTPHLITGLVPGEYTLNEVIAPNGYILSDETIRFTVKADGSVTSVVMYNTPKSKPTPQPTPQPTPNVPTGREIVVENTASSRTVVPTLFGGLSLGLGTITIKKRRKKGNLI